MRVFVGYGGPKARVIAERLHAFLQVNGIEAYIAPNMNPPGEWNSRVQGALRKADVFLVVCTPHSMRSRELFKEVILATDWGTTFESFLDERVNQLGPMFPRIMRDSDFVPFDRRNPEVKFPEVLGKLQKLADELPYRLIEPVEAVPAR